MTVWSICYDARPRSCPATVTGVGSRPMAAVEVALGSTTEVQLLGLIKPSVDRPPPTSDGRAPVRPEQPGHSARFSARWLAGQGGVPEAPPPKQGERDADGAPDVHAIGRHARLPSKATAVTVPAKGHLVEQEECPCWGLTRYRRRTRGTRPYGSLPPPGQGREHARQAWGPQAQGRREIEEAPPTVRQEGLLAGTLVSQPVRAVVPSARWAARALDRPASASSSGRRSRDVLRSGDGT